MYIVHLFTLKAHFNWDEPLLINHMWLVVPYWTAWISLNILVVLWVWPRRNLDTVHLAGCVCLAWE